MAITPSALSGVDAGSGTTVTSSSILPATDALVIASVSGRRADSTNYVSPTGLAGCGLTWVEIGTAVVYDTGGGSRRGGSMFRALGSPTTGPVTATYADSYSDFLMSIVQFTGVDTSGTNGSGAIVQEVKANGSSTTASVVLAGFGDSVNNMGFAFVSHETSETLTVGSGFTAFHQDVSGGGLTLLAEYKLGQDLLADATFSTSSQWGIKAIEIKMATAASAGAPLPYPYMKQRRRRPQRRAYRRI